MIWMGGTRYWKGWRPLLLLGAKLVETGAPAGAGAEASEASDADGELLANVSRLERSIESDAGGDQQGPDGGGGGADAGAASAGAMHAAWPAHVEARARSFVVRPRIVGAAAGDNHLIALDENGTVYGCGRGLDTGHSSAAAHGHGHERAVRVHVLNPPLFATRALTAPTRPRRSCARSPRSLASAVCAWRPGPRCHSRCGTMGCACPRPPATSAPASALTQYSTYTGGAGVGHRRHQRPQWAGPTAERRAGPPVPTRRPLRARPRQRTAECGDHGQDHAVRDGPAAGAAVRVGGRGTAVAARVRPCQRARVVRR